MTAAFLTAASLAATGQTAVAPTLLSATASGGHVSVSWTLPPDGSTSYRVQIATSAATGGQGEFFSENVVADDFLDDAQTTWTSVDPLPAGLYYVHVSDSNLTCERDDGSDCFSAQWSQDATVRVPLTLSYSYGARTLTGAFVRGRALAGRTFQFVVRSTTGALPATTRGTCGATATGIVWPKKTRQGLVAGTFYCSWLVPATIAGKTMHVDVAVFFGSAGGFTKTLALKIAAPSK